MFDVLLYVLTEHAAAAGVLTLSDIRNHRDQFTLAPCFPVRPSLLDPACILQCEPARIKFISLWDNETLISLAYSNVNEAIVLAVQCRLYIPTFA